MLSRPANGAVPDGFGGYHLQNWMPPSGSGGKPIEVHTQLNVDGHRIADAVAYHIARRLEESHGAGTYDGSMHPTPVEHLPL